IYLQRPMPVVLKLIEQATALEGAKFAGTAELLAGKAQVLAAMGQRDHALAAISRAKSAFDQLPDHIVREPGSIFGWPEDRIRHAEAYVHAGISDGRTADSSIDRALQLYGPSRIISRAQLELHRALSLVRCGEISAGTRHADSVVNALPADQVGQLVL